MLRVKHVFASYLAKELSQRTTMRML
ncbi:hypothetical protein NC652_008442 [Populus alba x Populus x berolinensis]|uniref:Uncharacterized protein n=1 Tax=Populus alba x Populus x berolinensis TaxID=444605 RepID=A0AAD6WA63_9ROSI|nr:hypothetical protein NC652_008442 [Populus alba x Populus x berolinensis]KAJ7003249.1 hypothetical protein NC653_008480 [Populus alba x Populus x berolinensis]